MTIIPEIDIILDDIKTEYKNTKVIKNVVTVFSKDIFKTKLQLTSYEGVQVCFIQVIRNQNWIALFTASYMNYIQENNGC